MILKIDALNFHRRTGVEFCVELRVERLTCLKTLDQMGQQLRAHSLLYPLFKYLCRAALARSVSVCVCMYVKLPHGFNY